MRYVMAHMLAASHPVSLGKELSVNNHSNFNPPQPLVMDIPPLGMHWYFLFDLLDNGNVPQLYNGTVSTNYKRIYCGIILQILLPLKMDISPD